MPYRWQTAVRCLLLFLFIFPGPARSQDGSDPEFEEEAVIEEVVVLGSRVKRSNLDSPSPVMVFDAEQLLNNGITTLGEFARYLPQNADTMSDSQSAPGSFRGSSSFNLRGIGLDATLTLVNGRRVAPFGASGDEAPFVDINSIPVAAIERIEVLKDGASAIYGSEAVAGVVNIITRKKIEGLVVEGGYMSTTEGDGDEWDINIAGGWNNSSTSVTGTLSYFERSEIYSRDRDWSSELDLRDQGGGNSRSAASSPPSVLLLESDVILADPECPEQTDINTHEADVPGEFELCLFNWAQFMTLQQPSDRFGLTASLEHAFSPRLSLFAELLLNRNKTRSVLAPTPMQNIFVPGYHPNNPFSENVLIWARAVDTGDRGFETKVTTWRALAGLRGGFSEWEWEAALMGSESESDEGRLNGILRSEFNEALLGFGGPGGDQFYNPFGLNTQNDPEVIDQFTVSGTGTKLTTNELTVDLQITGNWGNLPGGPVGSAFGFQARSQELKQRVDEEELTGAFLGGGGILPIDADRDIYSVFAEFVLPLHQTLEAQVAARYDHYSDFGSTTNPKIGLGWRPLDEVLFRVTWGTSFRPPTFRELYDPLFQFDGFSSEDPHRCPVTGEFGDCFGHAIQIEFQGNPDLNPGEGETALLGVVWEPSFAPGLALSLDFWQVEHTNRILRSDDEIWLELLDPFTNPFVIRTPQTAEDIALGIPGAIIKTSDTYINGDKLDTNGLDFDLNYVWNSDRAGNFSATLNYTYLNEHVLGTDFMGVDLLEEDFAGRYGFFGALPKHHANIQFTWNRNAHGASALIAYTGEYESWLDLHIDGRDTGEPFIVDDYAQLDLQYSYIFESLKGGLMRVGCRNCTDADPPVYNTQVYAEAFHEGRGAMVYLRWSQPF